MLLLPRHIWVVPSCCHTGPRVPVSNCVSKEATKGCTVINGLGVEGLLASSPMVLRDDMRIHDSEVIGRCPPIIP